MRMTVLALPLLLLWSAPSAEAGGMKKLTRWMTGSFSSAQQSKDDESYFDIRLQMVPIWTDRDDGPWLYVEQAAASGLGRPYRQRVYHLTKLPDGRFSSEVYSFAEPLRHAGAWKEQKPLEVLSPDHLKVREGCAVILERKGKAFVGSTVEDHCQSSLRGATYATSKVAVTKNVIESWDQGFDADGEQVWGAEKGPYLFVRLD